MTPISLVLVEGTWRGCDWAHEGTPFRRWLEAHHYAVYQRTHFWTGDVDGLPRWMNLAAAARHSDWKFGGEVLADHLRRIPFEQRNIIAHSHGGAVVAYQCIHPAGVPIRRLITVGTPPRADLDRDVWPQAKTQIGYWLHIYDSGFSWWSDWWRRLGQFGDSRFGWVDEQPLADHNRPFSRIGHTELLRDHAHFYRWSGLLDCYVRQETLNGSRNPVSVV